jgi:tetratricopeptide (TPR) repeat protein
VAHRALASAYAALNRLTMGDDLEVTRRLLEDSVRLAAESDREHPLLRLLGALTRAFFFPADERSAIASMAAFEACFDDPDPWARAAAHTFHGHGDFNVGHDDEGERQFMLGLEGFRSVGDRWGISFTLGALAEMSTASGNHRAAAGHLAEALRLATEFGINGDLAQMQAQYARQLLIIGERDRALAALAEAERSAERVGLPESVAAVAYERGEFARTDGDRVEACRCLERARDVVSGLTVAPQFMAMISTSLGWVAAAEGDLGMARAHHEQALNAALSSQDLPAIRRVLVGVADYALRHGDAARAAALLGAAADGHGRPNRSQAGAADVEAAARAALDDKSFAEAYQRGRDTPAHGLADLAGVTPGA